MPAKCVIVNQTLELTLHLKETCESKISISLFDLIVWRVVSTVQKSALPQSTVAYIIN